MQYVLTSYVDGDETEMVSSPMPFGHARTIFAQTLKMPLDEITQEEGKEQKSTLPTGEEITLRPAEPEEIIEVEDDTLMLDNIIANYSQERLKVAFDRAVAEFDGDVDDYEDEDFVESYTRHLVLMAGAEVVNGLTDQGWVETNGVNDSGDVIYAQAA